MSLVLRIKKCVYSENIVAFMRFLYMCITLIPQYINFRTKNIFIHALLSIKRNLLLKLENLLFAPYIWVVKIKLLLRLI